MRQRSNLIHSLIFEFFNRNSMRLRLFGFPDESPHATPGPDDFYITRMMRAGLMELRVSGGISPHRPKLVDKTSRRPLTQSAAELLTQQSWGKQREGRRKRDRNRQIRRKYKVRHIYIRRKSREIKRGWNKYRDFNLKKKKKKTGNGFKGIFSRWVHSDCSSLTSFNWINEQVRPDFRIFTSPSEVGLQLFSFSLIKSTFSFFFFWTYMIQIYKFGLLFLSPHVVSWISQHAGAVASQHDAGGPRDTYITEHR